MKSFKLSAFLLGIIGCIPAHAGKVSIKVYGGVHNAHSIPPLEDKSEDMNALSQAVCIVGGVETYRLPKVILDKEYDVDIEHNAEQSPCFFEGLAREVADNIAAKGQMTEASKKREEVIFQENTPSQNPGFLNKLVVNMASENSILSFFSLEDMGKILKTFEKSAMAEISNQSINQSLCKQIENILNNDVLDIFQAAIKNPGTHYCAVSNGKVPMTFSIQIEAEKEQPELIPFKNKKSEYEK